MSVSCNAGNVKTNQKVRYGTIDAWYMPEGIANIFSMHALEKLYRIMYNIIEGYYVVHTNKGPVCFHKDEQGMPFIDLKDIRHGGRHDAANIFIQTVHDKY